LRELGVAIVLAGVRLGQGALCSGEFGDELSAIATVCSPGHEESRHKGCGRDSLCGAKPNS
jgi:hypothetical protein